MLRPASAAGTRPVDARRVASRPADSDVQALAQIDGLDTGIGGGPEPDSVTLETFAEPIPEP